MNVGGDHPDFAATKIVSYTSLLARSQWRKGGLEDRIPAKRPSPGQVIPDGRDTDKMS